MQDFEKIADARMYQGYGLTEAGPIIAATPVEGDPNYASTGLPYPDTEVKIMDLQVGETRVIEFPLVADWNQENKVAYGIYELQEQKGVYLNTTYFNWERSDVTVVLDRQLYRPGDTVEVTVDATITGTLDVVAPGGDVSVDQNYDEHPDGVLQETFPFHLLGRSFGWGLYYAAGTSMASPHAAGVAALIRAINPHYTPRDVRAALINTAKDLGAPGWDKLYGYGLVDAAAALRY